MTSPFSTFEEFSSAEGPIYTFANNPTMITVLLIISALITIYFFYASFGMTQTSSKSPDVKAIGLLLVAGFASVMGLLNPQADRREAINPRHSQEIRSERSTWQPLALLGLVGLGGGSKGRTAKRRGARKGRRMR
ncbi:MAG: hypothetical protein SFY66_16960 [Oculatellaceae cyanobacterium bins.114]|nr:hypothetical protein [Oculatellaceae cyanobacterium bins.114]